MAILASSDRQRQRRYAWSAAAAAGIVIAACGGLDGGEIRLDDGAGGAAGAAGDEGEGGDAGDGGGGSSQEGGAAGDAGAPASDAGTAGETTGGSGGETTGGAGGETSGGAGGEATGGTSGAGASGETAGGGSGGGGGASGGAGGEAGAPNPDCGNGQLDDDEECDDGPDNDDGAVCTSQCRNAICGDGLVYAAEEDCDTGTETDDCDADCSEPSCGDGEINEAAGEVCDAGNANGARNMCALSCAFVCEGNCPLHVRLEAADGGDGTTWDEALNDLQEAVDLQFDGNGGAVWVKVGTFDRPSAGQPVLEMQRGVAIYGGFAGDEGSTSERSLSTLTVLDGGGTRGSVVVGATNGRLDGFTVRGGNADNDMSIPEIDGGGMENDGIEGVVVENCEFLENQAHGCGGGMKNSNAEVQVVNTLFSLNLSELGSGMCNRSGANVELIDVDFVDNRLQAFPTTELDALVLGGGMYTHGSTVTMRGGSFSEHAGYANFDTDVLSSGSAIWSSGSSLLFFDIGFDSNDGGFGAVVDIDAGAPEFVNCSFTRNVTGNSSLATVRDYGSASFINCTFAENGGPDTVNLIGTSNTKLVNSVAWVESNAISNIDGITPGNTTNSCVFFTSGLGGSPRPFPQALMNDESGLPRYVLVQEDENPCLDAGGDAAATAADLDWQSRTTSPNGCLDSGALDAGRHYSAAAGAEPCL